MTQTIAPIHPGEILREEWMIPLGLCSTTVAHAVDVVPERIDEIVSEHQGISNDMARRLANYFVRDAQSWLNLQQHYELMCATFSTGGHS